MTGCSIPWQMRCETRLITCILVFGSLAEPLAAATRVLSETIVGDPEPRKIQSPEETNDTVVFPGVVPSEPAIGSGGENPIVSEMRPIVTVEVGAYSGLSHARTKAITPQSTTSYSDPTADSFGLSGRETGLEIKRYVGSGFLGLNYSRSSLEGSVDLSQGLTNTTTLNSKVELDANSLGLVGGFSASNGSGRSLSQFGLTRHSYDLSVKDNARVYLFGFPFPGTGEVALNGDFVSADLGIQHEQSLGRGWSVGVAQSYKTPISGSDFAYDQFTTSVSVKKEFARDSSLDKVYRSRSETNRPCGALEIFGGQHFSVVSASETATDGRRSTTVENELGWDGGNTGVRFRFGGDPDGCHQLSLSNFDRTIAYRIKNPSASRQIDSLIDLPISGQEIRYAYQPSLISSPSLSTYLTFGTGIWVGKGDLTSRSQFLFDDVSSASEEGIDFVLLDFLLGAGARYKISDWTYLFYELSTARFDARPFGQDIFGWESGVKVGLGANL